VLVKTRGRTTNGAIDSRCSQTCESCRSLDVRELHCRDLLRTGPRFGWKWRNEAGRAADIQNEAEDGAIVLVYRIRNYNVRECMNCGRRVAKLYLGGDLFACRRWWGLAYASQQDSDRDFGWTRRKKSE
jgi:hypothetical protein